MHFIDTLQMFFNKITTTTTTTFLIHKQLNRVWLNVVDTSSNGPVGHYLITFKERDQFPCRLKQSNMNFQFLILYFKY